MAQMPIPYDPSQHQPSDPDRAIGGPLGAGWYAMMMIESEYKANKAGTGGFLEATFEIIENCHPTLKGRRVWERFNLQNANAKTVEIAHRDMAALCVAVGHVGPLADSALLHHKAVAIRVTVEAASGGYKASNNVAGYDVPANRFPGGVMVTPSQEIPEAAPVAATVAPIGVPPAGIAAAPVAVAPVAAAPLVPGNTVAAPLAAPIVDPLAAQAAAAAAVAAAQAAAANVAPPVAAPPLATPPTVQPTAALPLTGGLVPPVAGVGPAPWV